MSAHTSDEALAGGAAQGSKGLAHSASHRFATSAAEDKVFYTFRACLAREGHALSRSDASDGKRTYFVSRWNLVRELHTLDDVKRFAEQVGVAT